METTPPLLEASNITKTFGSFVANDAVNFSITQGEIQALLGENGAGKSTLVKILFGSLQPTRGFIKWRGERVDVANPFFARRLGIGMVFQHFSLFDSLTVAENIALSFDSDLKLHRLDEISSHYDLPLEPTALVGDLSAGERQRIEIVRCLMQNPSLIILDEPTSVLTPQEAEKLFITLKKLAGEGKSVLYISHRLDEVQQLCTSATILRRGKVVDKCNPQNESAATLAKKMVGENIKNIVPRQTSDSGESLLTVGNLSVAANADFGTSLHNINFEIKSGEILGIAGIAGNGQNELFETLSTQTTSATGATNAEITMCNTAANNLNISAKRKLNVAFVCEQRVGEGAVGSFRLSQNLFLTRHASDAKSFCKSFLQFIKTRALKNVTKKICTDMDVRKSSADPFALSLSGGNLQKFIVGRELNRAPKLLIINQPTWGVDAGAAALIRQNLIDLANAGSAILVISQDLDEIFAIATHIAVMCQGTLSTPLPLENCNRQQIGLMMMENKNAH